MSEKILVTGGAGYIGSHTVVELLKNNDQIFVADSLVNSSIKSLKAVEKITGKKIKFYKVDLRNEFQLNRIFASNKFDSVIHFAGLKAVGESVEKPLLYYDNNVVGSIVLLKLMKKYNVCKLVFSSSCCVYGDPKKVPIDENFPIVPINPYGRTKAIIERMIEDISAVNKNFKAVVLRYFNPVGAHESALIGEDPNGIPNNLVPFIAQVAVGKLKELKIFGGDYDTPDGTGIRDYIHITDLALAHLKALDALKKTDGFRAYNIGTGKGTSVLEVIKAFEKACGKKISYKIVERRPGDSAVVYANSSKANNELNWISRYNIDDMCKSVWSWQSKNPNGFAE